MMSSSSSPSSSSLSTMIATSVVFASTITWFVRRKRKEHDDDDDIDVTTSSRTLTKNDAEQQHIGNIGSRGLFVLKPPIPYLNDFFQCLNDPYHFIKNPQGYIALCMAENNLIHDLLKKRLVQSSISKTAFSDETVYSYNSFLGLPIAREAVAYFLAKRFYLSNNDSDDDNNNNESNNRIKKSNKINNNNNTMSPDEALSHINPHNVAIGAGCAGILHSLCYALGEPNDIVLIPAPYYAGFENDIRALARCVAYPVIMDNPELGPSVSDLNRALQDIKTNKKFRKQRVKFLLITNPNNPLGVIYKPDVIRNAIQWSRSNKIHTIVDEIFALSTHKKYGHGFQSVIKILDNNLQDDVHMIWALSKDFGASGFRVGVLYTQNTVLLQSLANLNIFSGVSHPIQMIMAELLTDDKFVDEFLDESRKRLLSSYNVCKEKLDEMVVPYVHASAGMFIYIDLSSLLPTTKASTITNGKKQNSSSKSLSSFDGERQLTQIIVKYAHLVLTPGENQRDDKPGRFRLCYTWTNVDTLQIAMERLSKLVIKIRKIGTSSIDYDACLNDQVISSSLGSIIE